MNALYEFQVKEMCKKYTQKELAEIALGYQKTSEMCVEDNEALRKENETLRYLITKYKIWKEVSDADNRSKSGN